MHVPAVDAGLYHGEGGLLALQDRVVHLSQFFVWLTLDERAGHIGVVAGREVHREDVDDDRLPGLQRPVAALVRVGALRAARGYGAVRGAVAPEKLHVYLGAQQLTRKGLAAPDEGVVASEVGLFEDGSGGGGGRRTGGRSVPDG